MVLLLESALASLFATIIVVELVLASPLISLLGTLAVQSRKSVRLIGNRAVSDHWKERVLPIYAIIILRTSLLCLLWMISLFMIFALGLYAGAWLFAGDFEGFAALQRIDYMLASILTAIVYLTARRRLLRHV